MRSEHGYELIVYDEHDVYVALAPELPGCAATGATHAQAVAGINVAIGEWIATARAHGRAIPEPVGAPRGTEVR